MNELNKIFATNENNYLSDTKTNINTQNDLTEKFNYNTLTMAITNNGLNLNNLTKLFDSEEIINIKKLEKGVRTIFVPHSAGVYVSINLNPNNMESITNFDSNFEVNKFFKCNAILNIENFDPELKELLW